ncbi:MAG TPA: phosphatase [Erythrobacter sp.]|nr:phosphatase [Erythrobacter sp.]
MSGSLDRRKFLAATSSAFAALAASGCSMRMASAGTLPEPGYGELLPDPEGLLDLPPGFTYRVISKFGDPMDDGGTVPNAADGMGCFDLGNGKLALLRNHELNVGQPAGAELQSGYGRGPDGVVFPGGTTNLVLDSQTLKVERQFRTLAGTIRNCAGGVTPWGTWLTCEELGHPYLLQLKDHGYVFEIPANATGLVDPVPLKAMGRFTHEAACVDPATNMIYMTEDNNEGLLYRFIPNTPGRLTDGGRLQALALERGPTDARNWEESIVEVGQRFKVRWVDLDNVEAPDDDLRVRGAAQGAVKFARGEGIHMGDGELYFCSTSGGAARLGQIFKLTPGKGRKADRLELFFESESEEQFNYGDNLCVAPNGHLIVCEDQYGEVVDNYLRGIDPAGRPYPLGRLRTQTELAGACYSPDGRWLFVNVYAPTVTLAISGPWAA